MNKIAVIDIGSNSVRLMLLANGKVLYKILNTTQLGEGLAHSAFLKPEAIDRTAKAIAKFYQQAVAEGATRVVAFATAAARSAKNSLEFTTKVKELCGLEIEILSGEEEAEIGILGALGNKDGGIIDIGGASTELILVENSKAVYKKSVDIGVVRLKELAGKTPELLYGQAEKAVRLFDGFPFGKTLHAIGGTATTLGAVDIGLDVYDSAALTGHILSLAGVERLSRRLQSLSIQEISQIPCVPALRADVLTGGAVLLETIMKQLQIPQIIISDSDNLEGYAKKRGLME